RCARCRATWFASVAELALPMGQDGTEPTAPATDEHREAEQEEQAPGDAEDAAADPTSLIIANAPSLVPALAHENGTGAATGPDIETLAARRERQAAGKSKRRRRSWPGLPTIILVLAGVLAALVNWRAAVVSFVPQTAGLFSSIGLPVNLRGLSLDDVKTTETHEGVTVLVVDGTIANLTRQPLEVPRLRFAVRNAAGYA